MASMIECPTCKQSVAAEAATCPLCSRGLTSPGGFSLSDPVHVAALVLGLVLLGAIILGAFFTA